MIKISYRCINWWLSISISSKEDNKIFKNGFGENLGKTSRREREG